MDQTSELRLAKVHPLLAQKVRAAAALLAEGGVEIRVVQGLRTYAEQDALFAQGPTVTKARGGYSSHNFGMAVDVAPGAPGARSWTPNWVVSSPGFKQMVAALKQKGLKWGGDWVTMKGDFDHFYLAGSPDTPTDEMRADFAAGGLPQVFANFDMGKYAVGV
jgi:peptidoglycan L-alanyl-D-glutamate endopeptidase CwlK